MSPVGTFAKSWPLPKMSAYWGRPEVIRAPQNDVIDPEETSPGRGTSRGEIRDPLLSDADRSDRGGSPFSAKSSPISIRWSPQPRAELAPSLNARAWPCDVREWPKCMDRPALGNV
jgi:hypothetical protein